MSDGTVVEFTKPAVFDWLTRCDLSEAAETLLGRWMSNDYPILLQNNLACGPKTQPMEGDTPTKISANDSTNRLTLTDKELVELTGRKRGCSQHRVLQSMRIPAKLRADGAVIVFRQDLESSANRKNKSKSQPNFDALG